MIKVILDVHSVLELPKTPQEFKKHFIKFYDSIELRTNSTNFWFLIILAHVHYKTDLFPDFLDFGFLKSVNNAYDYNENM